jgi:PAS domain S-box-containing protein
MVSRARPLWKELQAGLRESEARLQLFIEHGPAAQAMFDKGLRYLAASRRWREDHGLGDSPFLGRRHPEVAPAFPPAWEAAHRRALAGEVVSRDEDALPGPGGSVRWLRWEARPWRDPDGEVQGIVVFSEDFTQRKQAEERVHQLNASLEKRVEERTSELQAANQELEAFSYAVSHDLRSPMRAMSGFSQALQEDFAAQLPPDARSYLDQIALGARRMGDLIDGLLALSRVTRGDLERDPVDLGALAREVRDELERSDPARRVDWRIQEGLWVQGDARMLQVVVRNLLENAWKYTSKVPQAAIAVERVEEEGEPAVQVTDNGAGFDMAYASKLFAPFQRLHRQDEFPGLGIGLATVQRILHRHGGRIQARSQPGRGAAFTLFLPLLEVQP